MANLSDVEMADQQPLALSRTGLIVAGYGKVSALAHYVTVDGQAALASGGRDGTIRRWNATTGQPIGDPMTGHIDAVTSVISYLTDDGEPILVSSGRDGTIRRWNAVSGTPAGPPLVTNAGEVLAVTSYQTSEGHRALASAGDDGTIRRWDAVTGQPIGEPLPGHSGAVLSVISYPTGMGQPALVSAGDDGRICWWSAVTGERLRDPSTGHITAVTSVTSYVMGNGHLALASCGADGTVRRWNADTGRPVGGPLGGHANGLRSITSYLTSDRVPALASADAGGTIRRWDALTGQPIGDPVAGHTGVIASLISYGTGDGHSVIVSAGDDGRICRWNATTGLPIGDPLTGHTGHVRAVASYVTNDGHPVLASAADDGRIRRWNAATGQPIGEPLAAVTGQVLSVITYTASDGQPALVACDVDGKISRWTAATGRAIDVPINTRAGAVFSMTSYTTSDGRAALVGGDVNGKIRRWDATTGRSLGVPLAAHAGGVWALTSYQTAEEQPALASAGGDGAIRRWDATTGRSIGAPLTGHAGGVWTVTSYRTIDGRPALASVGVDGTIRRWDATTGQTIGQPLSSHTGAVWALTSYATGEGRPTLASAGGDGTIRRWDATTGHAIGQPLSGHTGAVRAIAAYTTIDGDSALASTGDDGTLLLWNADTGKLMRRLFVEPIRLRGLADRRAPRDLLGRKAVIETLALLLQWSTAGPMPEPGPNVVTIEGPWGSGKTSVMHLVREAVSGSAPTTKDGPRLTVASAARMLRRGSPPKNHATPQLTDDRRRVTAWFNPWTHQSSDQIWAGLARAILDAVGPALFHSPAGEQRYWFVHNLDQVDRDDLRHRLFVRSISPIFSFTAICGLAAILFQITNLKIHMNQHLLHTRLTPNTIAIVSLGILILAGVVDSLRRRWLVSASTHLPPEVIRGPIRNIHADFNSPTAEHLHDPFYQARSGYLYLIQHDIDAVIADLRDAGYDLVVFIDDLDRCSARTTAEVFEALNLFLAGFHGLEARFVIGLDPAIVAAHLDGVYKELSDPDLVMHGDDPSPGWAFLRKVVQLPVQLPQISGTAADEFLADSLGTSVRVIRASVPSLPGLLPAAPRESIPVQYQPSSAQSAASATIVATTRTGAIEHQPEVLAMIRRRLAEQPQRSAREAKRLLNVWQLYQRILDKTAPLADDDSNIERACDLVILAEIITRWPALQPRLHRPIGGRRALQILAESAAADDSWQAALQRTQLASGDLVRRMPNHDRALNSLRELLVAYDGVRVADLAARIL